MNQIILIKKLSLFILIIIGVTFLLGFFNERQINKSVFHVDTNINKLILGASTSECAINDTIFKNSVNMSHSADSFLYSFLKMKKMIEFNSNIDTVFLAISPKSILKSQEEIWLFNKLHFADRIGNYFYLMENEDLELFIDHFGYEFYKMSIANVVTRNFRNFKEYLIGDLKEIYGGYLALDRNKLDEALAELENDNSRDDQFTVSKIELSYLDKMIQLSNKNDIELIFISLPKREEYLKKYYQDNREFNKFIEKNYSNIPYLDFGSFQLPRNAYADLLHLNYEGSLIFSKYLQDKGIKNVVLESNY